MNARHRPPQEEPEGVTLVEVLIGGILIAVMATVAVWALSWGSWLVATFAVSAIGLTVWDEWMRWRRR